MYDNHRPLYLAYAISALRSLSNARVLGLSEMAVALNMQLNEYVNTMFSPNNSGTPVYYRYDTPDKIVVVYDSNKVNKKWVREHVGKHGGWKIIYVDIRNPDIRGRVPAPESVSVAYNPYSRK